jgi:hypothetical protein
MNVLVREKKNKIESNHHNCMGALRSINGLFIETSILYQT